MVAVSSIAVSIRGFRLDFEKVGASRLATASFENVTKRPFVVSISRYRSLDIEETHTVHTDSTIPRLFVRDNLEEITLGNYLDTSCEMRSILPLPYFHFRFFNYRDA